jgi:hypothetical protein
MTLSGIEPAIFRFVAQYRNHRALAPPPPPIPSFVVMRFQQLTFRHTHHDSVVTELSTRCEFTVRHYFDIQFKKPLLISAGRQNDESNMRCFLSLRNMHKNAFELVEQSAAERFLTENCLVV